MATPTSIVAYLALFVLVGAAFLFANLLLGYLLRPSKPTTEKLEIYECGEPTIGSSFVQFDLRFYVVALLFIIFEVEVAFFFPWATVFGKAAELTATSAPIVAADQGDYDAPANQLSSFAHHKFRELGVSHPTPPDISEDRAAELGITTNPRQRTIVATREMARDLAWMSFTDIGVFFAVLLMGFAYVWKRGDLDWVRYHYAHGPHCVRFTQQSLEAPSPTIQPLAKSMNFQSIHKHIEHRLGNAITSAEASAVDPWIVVEADRWFDVAKVLRNDGQLAFDYLNCITGIDYCEPDAKKAAKVTWQPHVEVVYHLSSLVHRHRLVVKLLLPRWKDDKPGELPPVPSVASLWSTANWHEREVYDLMGIEFTGHPDLRRILCPEDWLGHPLRKDYQMPLEYHGIRGR